MSEISGKEHWQIPFKPGHQVTEKGYIKTYNIDNNDSYTKSMTNLFGELQKSTPNQNNTYHSGNHMAAGPKATKRRSNSFPHT
jgi:hypothetical protein